MSQTCSSGFQALGQAAAWIESGMASRFLVTGSEAPLTPYFTKQMAALGIYTSGESDYPNRSLDLAKTANTFVLGEGASSVAIEAAQAGRSYLSRITGIGFGRETTNHPAGIHPAGSALRQSMEQALTGHDRGTIDAVVAHSPGTLQGDKAEAEAIKTVFNRAIPTTGNKWKIGHTLGASGLFSLELGLAMFAHDRFIGVPYLDQPNDFSPTKLIINAQGFGGHAVSIIIERD
jgi:3-oxoacyl-(acyl-carrier-protein) synthase